MLGVAHKRVPNLNHLDQSSDWHRDNLSEGRVAFSTYKRTPDCIDSARSFAIKTMENAGWTLEYGEVTPESRSQILLRVTFIPGGGT